MARFDALRRLFGREPKPCPTAEMDVALKDAFPEWAAATAPAKPEWLTHCAPLVERFEGLHKLIPGNKVQAYPDPGTGGKPWTIGIGSTRDEQGKPIQPSDVWPVDRARKHFENELEEYGTAVVKALAGAKTTPRQLAACVSLAYNIGTGAFAGSTLLKRHKAGEYAAAADQFLRWNRAGGRVMRGLTRRREAERALYNG